MTIAVDLGRKATKTNKQKLAGKLLNYFKEAVYMGIHQTDIY